MRGESGQQRVPRGDHARVDNHRDVAVGNQSGGYRGGPGGCVRGCGARVFSVWHEARHYLVGSRSAAPVPRVLCAWTRKAAENGAALDLLLGEAGGRVAGPGRAELAAAMGSPSVVVGLVLGQDQPQMPLPDDQHPVCGLCPGGEHEPFGIGVRPGASGRDLHGLDTSASEDRVE